MMDTGQATRYRGNCGLIPELWQKKGAVSAQALSSHVVGGCAELHTWLGGLQKLFQVPLQCDTGPLRRILQAYDSCDMK